MKKEQNAILKYYKGNAVMGEDFDVETETVKEIPPMDFSN